METPCLQPINKETNQRILNLGSNIKDNMLWDVFFHIFLKMKKSSKTPHIPFLMLDASTDNCHTKIIFHIISIRNATINSFLNFNVMVNVTCKGSENNQCSWD